MGLISRVSSRTYRKNMSSNSRSKGASTYSKETQDLLKLMMKESHITNQQRAEMNKAMKNGGSLPGTLPESYKKTVKSKKSGNQKPVPSPGSTITGYKLRTKEDIQKTGDLDREAYRGKPIPRSRELVKEELENLMAYGVKEIPKSQLKQVRQVEKPRSRYQVLTDRFEELSADVVDCELFMKDMTKVPGGSREIPAVNVQIALKKKEMQDLDRQMKELES